MKKILHVSTTSFMGGAETLALRIARALKGEDFDFDCLVTIVKGTLQSEFEKTYSNVFFRKDKKCRIDFGKYDKIHVLNAFEFETPDPFRRREIRGIHMGARGINKKNKAIIEKAGMVISDSFEHPVYQDNYAVIPNFVDTKFFKPDISEPRTILWVGKFHDTKGYKEMMDIFIFLAPYRFKFIIVDGVPMLEPAKQSKAILRQYLGDKLEVHEKLREPELLKLYQRSSHVLVTSTTEGTPIALLEAMSCGCVPVCRAVGGIPRIVNHGFNGWLFQSAPEAIGYLNSPAGEMPEIARETILSKHNQDDALEKYKKFYNK